MGAPTFYLIRHAETQWNADGRWQGHGDPPLSARGRAQAAELATALTGQPIDLLVTSDLQRALATAEAVAKALLLTPELDPRLRELDVGSWTGLTRDEIRARDPELLAHFETEDPAVRPGGGETRREFRLRVTEAVESLAERPCERIALVAHFGVIRALLPGAQPEHAEVRSATLGQIRAAARARGD